jgi:DNA modification methylase
MHIMAKATSIADLKPDPRNARKHGERNVRAMVRSLEELGAGRSILIDGKNQIIAGNGIVEAAAMAGIEKVLVVEASGNEIVAVRRADLTGKRRTRMALADNRTAEMAEWDVDVLEEIAAKDRSILEGLWSDAEIAEILLGDEAEDPGPQIDRAEELREQWGVKSGQLWQLGEHRLICGDCTKPEVVSRLMAGETARICHTDPPYGVDYANILGGRDDRKAGGWKEIEGDNLDNAKLGELITGALRLTDAPILFCWHSWRRIRVFLDAIEGCGWTPNCEIVWVKNALVFGRSDYQWRHECCIYAKRAGAGGQDDRTQTTVVELDKMHGSLHPTQKPPELWELSLRNHTVPGDILYDPFLGSGTAIVACENLGRKCRAVEISPAYVAVSLQRWADMTGKTPELVDG